MTDTDMMDLDSAAALNARQLSAITALLTESSLAAASEKCEVPERTLSRWLTVDSFRATLEEARTTLFKATVADMACLRSKAIETLAKCLDAGKDSDRIKAARSILDVTSKLHNADDRLFQRLLAMIDGMSDAEADDAIAGLMDVLEARRENRRAVAHSRVIATDPPRELLAEATETREHITTFDDGR